MLRLLAILTFTILAACSGQTSVKGTGTGTDDYHASPCACVFEKVPLMPVEGLL